MLIFSKKICASRLEVYRLFGRALPTTFSYETYAFKYLHLCPMLLNEIKSTHFKNLQYSICFIAFVVGSVRHCRI